MSEEANLYKTDDKKYVLRRNCSFLKWYNSLLNGHYEPTISLSDMQELIDYINYWCTRIKYPDRDLDYSDGIRNPRFKDVEPLSGALTMKQFLYRLNYEEFCLMECKYRNPGYYLHNVYIKRKRAGLNHEIMMNIYYLKDKENSHFVVKADESTGIVIPSEELSKYVNFDKDVYLDDLLMTFSDLYCDELDFSELVRTIYNHNCDLELRKHILEVAILKVFYSSSSYKKGFTRAKKFIDEVNEQFGVDISFEEFKKATIKNYCSEEEEEDKKDSFIHCRKRLLVGERK